MCKLQHAGAICIPISKPVTIVANTTCPFMSPTNTTISFWGIQLTKWNISFQRFSFSSSGFSQVRNVHHKNINQTVVQDHLQYQHSFTMPFDFHHTCPPISLLQAFQPHQIYLTSHPEQLIPLALSSKEPAATASPSCFLNTSHIHFSVRQYLHQFTRPSRQWVHVPGPDPKSPAFPQFMSP